MMKWDDWMMIVQERTCLLRNLLLEKAVLRQEVKEFHIQAI